MRAYRYVVHGRVQGVAFRFHAVEAAQRLGLRGWVRNRDDGAVEVVAAGGDEALQAFEDFLRRGPRAARVESVERREEAAEPPCGFTVRY